MEERDEEREEEGEMFDVQRDFCVSEEELVAGDNGVLTRTEEETIGCGARLIKQGRLLLRRLCSFEYVFGKKRVRCRTSKMSAAVHHHHHRFLFFFIFFFLLLPSPALCRKCQFAMLKTRLSLSPSSSSLALPAVSLFSAPHSICFCTPQSLPLPFEHTLLAPLSLCSSVVPQNERMSAMCITAPSPSYSHSLHSVQLAHESHAKYRSRAECAAAEDESSSGAHPAFPQKASTALMLMLRANKPIIVIFGECSQSAD